MRLAIADPPYLGRANRWYGDGRGHAAGRGRADYHPRARDWDEPDAHRLLAVDLDAEYDGWAIAGNLESLPIYLAAAPGTRVLAWGRGNAIPSGSRVAAQWEPVVVRIPPGRAAHDTGLATSDLLVAGINTRQRFAGAKPAIWTRWILDVLGYDPTTDELIDIFPGSGSVTTATDGMLALAEAGRQLASEREGLVAAGVDPDLLEIPLHPAAAPERPEPQSNPPRSP